MEAIEKERTNMAYAENDYTEEVKRDRSELENRVAALEAATHRLGKVTAMLDQRLRPVSVSAGPESDGPESSVPEEVLPEHHGELRRLARCIDREASRLEDALERLRL